jgi:hypothetical protein
MTLYQKIGKRYYPVRDTLAYDGLENGCWLVKVEHGSTSIRKSIDPNSAPLEFATLMKTNKICKYLSDVSLARPKQTPLTKNQLKIFKMFDKLPDKDKLLYWQYDSLQDMAENIIKLILTSDNKRS